MRRKPYRWSITPEEHLRAVEDLAAGKPLAVIAHRLNVTQRLLHQQTSALVALEQDKRIRPIAWAFLSHAHDDSTLALQVADIVEAALGPQLAVFCTSRAEHRIAELSEQSAASAGTLERALDDRLQNSAAILLLVTRHAIERQSQWIEFELDIATKRAGRKTGLAGQTEPASEAMFVPIIAGGSSLLSEITTSYERLFRPDDRSVDPGNLWARDPVETYAAVRLSDPETLVAFLRRLGDSINVVPDLSCLPPPPWFRQFKSD